MKCSFLFLKNVKTDIFPVYKLDLQMWLTIKIIESQTYLKNILIYKNNLKINWTIF